ncbi:hypothetical protein ACI2JI_12295 [Enterobacter cancerogenus]|jgi:hypothetical protein|uniref:hypothetical protein n=1 Tax=Enterobacter cancerogenus TaxID=69218 RepID=UPI00384B55CA
MHKLLSPRLQQDILQALSIFFPYPPTGKQYFSCFGDISELQMAVNIEALIEKRLICRRAISRTDDIPYVRLAYLHLTEKGFSYAVAHC